MQHWFPTFAYGPIVTAIVVNVSFALLASLVVFKVRYFDDLLKYPIAHAFVNSPNALLTLSLIFMASAAWQNSAAADTALQQERMALERLEVLTEGLHGFDGVRKSLAEYVARVKDEEWGARHNEVAIARVDELILDLSRVALRGGGIGAAGDNDRQELESIRSQMVRYIDQLATARSKRLELGRLANFGYLDRWILAWLMSFTVYLSLFLVHRARLRTALISVAVHCVCVICGMSMVSLHLHPYKGPRARTPSAIAVDFSDQRAK